MDSGSMNFFSSDRSIDRSEGGGAAGRWRRRKRDGGAVRSIRSPRARGGRDATRRTLAPRTLPYDEKYSRSASESVENFRPPT